MRLGGGGALQSAELHEENLIRTTIRHRSLASLKFSFDDQLQRLKKKTHLKNILKQIKDEFSRNKGADLMAGQRALSKVYAAQ